MFNFLTGATVDVAGETSVARSGDPIARGQFSIQDEQGSNSILTYRFGTTGDWQTAWWLDGEGTSVAGRYGTLYIRGNNWQYVLNEEHQSLLYLADGETLTESFQLRAVDRALLSNDAYNLENIVNLDIQINGVTKVAPTLDLSQGTDHVVDETDRVVQGEFTILNDADDQSLLTYRIGEDSDWQVAWHSEGAGTSVQGQYGTFHVVNGKWTYTLDVDNVDVASLGYGGVLVETVTLRPVEVDDRFDDDANSENIVHLNIEITSSHDVLKIHEGHPLNKVVFDAADGDASGKTFTLNTEFQDSDFFRIDAEGKVWWKQLPDYENPHDLNQDNVYSIEVITTSETGSHSKIMDIVVQDILTEKKGPALSVVRDLNIRNQERPGADLFETGPDHFLFFPSDIPEDELPSEFVQTLIEGTSYVMPEEGPMEITWSIYDGPTNSSPSLIKNQEDLERLRDLMNAVFEEYENVINVKFIEVGIDEAKGERGTSIIFATSDPGYRGGAAALPGHNSYVKLNFPYEGLDERFDLANIHQPFSEYYRVSHEVGHLLGLAHPFDKTHLSKWPSTHPSERYQRDEPELDHHTPTLLSYSSSREGRYPSLQEADIEALQFLYGTKENPQSILRFFDTSIAKRDLLEEATRFETKFDGITSVRYAKFIDLEQTHKSDAVRIRVEENSDDMILQRQLDLPNEEAVKYFYQPLLFARNVVLSIDETYGDGKFFRVDQETGGIWFKDTPDYENPVDDFGGRFAHNNVYQLRTVLDFDLFYELDQGPDEPPTEELAIQYSVLEHYHIEVTDVDEPIELQPLNVEIA